MQVSDFYQKVREEHGEKIASEWLEKMKDRDGAPGTYGAFYDYGVMNDLLETVL